MICIKLSDGEIIKVDNKTDNGVIKEIIEEELFGIKPHYEIGNIISEIIHLELGKQYVLYQDDKLLLEIENLPS